MVDKTIFAYITCVQIIKSASFVGRFILDVTSIDKSAS